MSGYSLCECGCGQPAPIATRTDSRAGAVKGQPRRFIRGHSGHRWEPGYGSVETPRLPNDWRQRISITDSGCWIWDRRNDQGYGLHGSTRAHRLSYELHVGPIPDGLSLDHVCHTQDTSCMGGSNCPHRGCINPDHLEPVTHRENSIRGRAGVLATMRASQRTHCKHGHEMTPENTIIRPRQRKCRECARQVSARNNTKRRGPKRG